MFLMSHDGTPYQIFYDLVGGHPVFYPMIVVVLFYVYIFAFVYVYNVIKKRINISVLFIIPHNKSRFHYYFY